MSANLINADNISLKLGSKLILDNISFALKAGEFITLIGPNGAGKSSLIKVLLGIIKPSSGKIIKDSNLNIGYVPQKFIPNQFIPISVISFIKLNQKNNNYLSEVIDLTGVKPLLNNYLKDLSGGEMQRVLLTRALLSKPNVLILDEPAQNLDIDGQMQLYKLIQDIHQQQKCAVLMVSHDLHRVMRESSKVLCLYRHICCMGRPETILKNEQFNTLFAGQIDDLMATYKHHHNHCHNH